MNSTALPPSGNAGGETPEELAATSLAPSVRIEVPINKGADPPLENVETGESLCVRVSDLSGKPIAGALIEIGLFYSGAHQGTTTVNGVYCVPLSKFTEPLSYLRISAVGFTTFEQSLDEQSQLTFDVALPEGGVMNVLVLDKNAVAVPGHWLCVVRIEGEGKWKTQFCTLTDNEGVAVIPGLLPGTWEIFSPQWRDKQPAERKTVEVAAGVSTPAELVVHDLPLHCFASGTVVLPEDARNLSDGTITGYRVEKEGTFGADATIYYGGWFYVFGQKDEVIKLRIRRGDEGPASEWMSVIVGEHDYRLRPAWPHEEASDQD